MISRDCAKAKLLETKESRSIGIYISCKDIDWSMESTRKKNKKTKDEREGRQSLNYKQRYSAFLL